MDRDDALADFSSRGPRLGDAGLKPEITAPGVDIVAARAAGTAMGQPVDNLYTAASGTSMATPHVAGAAALLAQQHPDWKADQLKNALVSTAKTQPEPDRLRAGRRPGRPDPGGRAEGLPPPASRTSACRPRPTRHPDITYRNDGAAPVTLSLVRCRRPTWTRGKPETDAFGVPAHRHGPGATAASTYR